MFRFISNKLAKLGDAIAISNLKLSLTHSLTDKVTHPRCLQELKIVAVG